ncbi:neuronal tyrosine-phosphorylated phosphoinositide-3-kinase adapter 2 [Trichomycterus rosablanca]|uniref:neuronal tyrosine-phosphorylated phosphoinositide-3-kinase adapter 2 n=1 Tax=Trichomycterus rosablanca TaxID=2290929 RepID=UPI002F355A0F
MPLTMMSANEEETFRFLQYVEDSGLRVHEGVARELSRNEKGRSAQEKNDKKRKQDDIIKRMSEEMAVEGKHQRMGSLSMSEQPQHFSVRSQSLNSVGGEEDEGSPNSRKLPPPKPRRDPTTKLSASSEAVDHSASSCRGGQSQKWDAAQGCVDESRRIPPPKPKRNPNTQLSTSFDESYILNASLTDSPPMAHSREVKPPSPNSPLSPTRSHFPQRDSDSEEPVYIEMSGKVAQDPPPRSESEEPGEAVYEEMKYPAMDEYDSRWDLMGYRCSSDMDIHGHTVRGTQLPEIPAPFPNLLLHRPPLLVFPPVPAQCSPNSDESPLTPMDVNKLPSLENTSYSKSPSTSSSSMEPLSSASSSHQRRAERELTATPTITISGRSSAPPLPCARYRSSTGSAGSQRSHSACPSPVSMGRCLTPLSLMRPPPFEGPFSGAAMPRHHSSAQNVASGRSRTPTSPLDELTNLFTSGKNMLKTKTSGRKSKEHAETESKGKSHGSESKREHKERSGHSKESKKDKERHGKSSHRRGSKDREPNSTEALQRRDSKDRTCSSVETFVRRDSKDRGYSNGEALVRRNSKDQGCGGPELMPRQGSKERKSSFTEPVLRHDSRDWAYNSMEHLPRLDSKDRICTGSEFVSKQGSKERKCSTAEPVLRYDSMEPLPRLDSKDRICTGPDLVPRRGSRDRGCSTSQPILRHDSRDWVCNGMEPLPKRDSRDRLCSGPELMPRNGLERRNSRDRSAQGPDLLPKHGGKELGRTGLESRRNSREGRKHSVDSHQGSGYFGDGGWTCRERSGNEADAVNGKELKDKGVHTVEPGHKGRDKSSYSAESSTAQEWDARSGPPSKISVRSRRSPVSPTTMLGNSELKTILKAGLMVPSPLGTPQRKTSETQEVPPFPWLHGDSTMLEVIKRKQRLCREIRSRQWLPDRSPTKAEGGQALPNGKSADEPKKPPPYPNQSPVFWDTPI